MKPMLFNSEMVRALLENRKTVTRRLVKLKYENTHLEMLTNKYGTRLIEIENEVPDVTTVKNPDGTTTRRVRAYIEKVPPYRPGDILYVRETWAYISDWTNVDQEVGLPDGYIYKADWEEGTDHPKWRPSIHMPSDATRLFLRVTDVRAERLQDIDDDGVVAEGLEIGAPFDELWDRTIKPADLARYGWEVNPYVFVISFEKISKGEALRNA